jgi:hypothetical protein
MFKNIYPQQKVIRYIIMLLAAISLQCSDDLSILQKQNTSTLAMMSTGLIYDPSNADLSNLTLSSGALTPPFAPATTSYTAAVNVSSIMVTPTAFDSMATVTVDGTPVASGTPSGSINTPYGLTPITLVVTAGDGLTTKTYSIAASRSNILPADFSGSRPITLDTTSGGANVSGDVSNFPVLIRITDPAIIDAANSGAPDLRFIDKDGTTWLDYEIERWDQTNDRAEVWVLVPTVLGNTSEVALTMYYNDVVASSIPDGQCAACVFDTTNGYYGAWHLNEDPSGGANSIKDRTTHAYHGSPTSMNAANLADGIIGKGLSFDGSADYINIDSATFTDPDEIPNSSTYTLSAWVKTGTSDSLWHTLFAFSVPSGNPFVGLGYGSTSPSFPHKPHLYHIDDTWQNARPRDTGIDIDDQAWHYMVATRNGADFKLYIDDRTPVTLTSGTVATTTTTLLQIGRNHWSGGTQYLNGILDEVQICNITASPDWVRLCYENQKASQTLITY